MKNGIGLGKDGYGIGSKSIFIEALKLLIDDYETFKFGGRSFYDWS